MSDKAAGAFPERLDLASLDVSGEKRTELLRLFPEVRTEDGRIDFDRLKLALGEVIDVGKERYGMNWPGKADCFKAIQTPSLGTLLPCQGESVNFDKTGNLIIEGDNLEALKLLQKSYLGRIKMIYIDPPYNTGNDFIYPDDYSESLDTYLEYTGQVDSEGRKFSTNTEADGRFHSKWMSMMYPRLYLARNLLRDVGVIFISIDDNEIHNLRRLCDEIFGEENYCGTFVWEKKKKPSFLNAQLGVTTEYIVTYARNRQDAPPFISGNVELGKLYPFNNAGNSMSILTFPRGAVRFWTQSGRIEAQNMSEGNIRTELLDPVEIVQGTNADPFRLKGEWRYSQARLDEFVQQGAEIVIRKVPFRPNYINLGERAKKIANLLTVKGTATPTYEDATDELRTLFGGDVMEYPKPVGLLQTLLAAVTGEDDLILDFFAGSGTTAHAVLNLNEQDAANRRFLLVQLPEPAGEHGYKTIADICKERVRRVIKSLEKEDASRLDLEGGRHARDRGFRAFKLAESNFTLWDAVGPKNAEQLERQLELHSDHVRAERTVNDLLYEILIKSGFPLSTPVETVNLAERVVYSVASGMLLVCLERELTLELIRAMAERKPERVVCLDKGFSDNDQLKVNAVQIFKNRGPINFRTI